MANFASRSSSSLGVVDLERVALLRRGGRGGRGRRLAGARSCSRSWRSSSCSPAGSPSGSAVRRGARRGSAWTTNHARAGARGTHRGDRPRQHFEERLRLDGEQPSSPDGSATRTSARSAALNRYYLMLTAGRSSPRPIASGAGPSSVGGHSSPPILAWVAAATRRTRRSSPALRPRRGADRRGVQVGQDRRAARPADRLRRQLGLLRFYRGGSRARRGDRLPAAGAPDIPTLVPRCDDARRAR